MNKSRCLHPCHSHRGLHRRDFVRFSAGALLGSAVLPSRLLGDEPVAIEKIKQCGPGSRYASTIAATFVRRAGEYGMRWPGAVYNGKATEEIYREKLRRAAGQLGIRFNLRPSPIHSLAEAKAWAAQAKEAGADGLMVMVHDRQEHSWPTVHEAVKTGLPTVAYSPLGTSFTTNTIHLAETPGCVIYSTDDFRQAEYGLKMLQAGAKMRHTRCVVLKGNRRFTAPLADTGISLQYVPAKSFLEKYRQMATSKQMVQVAEDYMRRARKVSDATKQDVMNGIKSYFVAGKILQEEEADAITMDCLGALGRSQVSLPCIAWSRMNDDGIPAACEADHGAVATHVITQYLFDRPGFQQDPVAETAVDGIIGAHCSCPTRLKGFAAPPEPFDIKHHHGNRDAVPRTLWQAGQRITCLDVLPAGSKGAGDEGSRSKFLISTGTVLKNLEVPPAGGCVVSVLVKMDGEQNVLSFPGFHQLFFYGDYKKETENFCQLYGFETQVV